MRQWFTEHRYAFTDPDMTYAELKAVVKAEYPDYVVEGGGERIRPGDPKLLGKEGEVHTHSQDANVVIRKTVTLELPRYVPPESTQD